MARFSLAAIIRNIRNIRRKQVILRDIVPPAVMATDLYRSCYRPVIDAWQSGIPRILAEYERTLASLTTDSPADVQREIDGIDAGLQRLILELTPRLRDWATRLERWHRGKWRGAVLSATGVDLQTMIGPEGARETIETAIQRNVGLIKDVSDQARGRITDAVFRGLNRRSAAVEVARDIRDAVEMGRRRARNIAAHQLSDISNRLADERRREAGLDSWAWRHSGKLHFREEHKARDGKVYTDETAPNDLPGSLPFCGCRSQAVITFD